MKTQFHRRLLSDATNRQHFLQRESSFSCGVLSDQTHSALLPVDNLREFDDKMEVLRCGGRHWSPPVPPPPRAVCKQAAMTEVSAASDCAAASRQPLRISGLRPTLVPRVGNRHIFHDEWIPWTTTTTFRAFLCRTSALFLTQRHFKRTWMRMEQFGGGGL